MFIYEYMAGKAGDMVEMMIPWYRGDSVGAAYQPRSVPKPLKATSKEPPKKFKGGDDYDPHEHRIVHKPTTYMDSMIHLVKGSIGAGILAMPDAMRRMGALYGSITLLTLATFAVYVLQLLIAAQYRLCKRYRRGYLSYQKSVRLSLQDGPPSLRWSANFMSMFTDFVLLLWQLGVCVVYFVFVAANLKQVLDYYGHVMSLRIHLCYLLPPMILLNIVKNLKLMTPISTISNAVVFFALVIIFFYLVEDDIVITEDKLALKSWGEIPLFIGTALFALEAVGVMLAIEYHMEHPKQFVGMFGLLNLGMFIIVMMYILVGVVGYIKYGDKIDAAITLNLPEDQKKAQVAKIAFSIAIFLSFPLQNYVAYEILWRKLKKKLTPSLKPGEKKKKKVYGMGLHHGLNPTMIMADYVLRVALVVLPWVLAFAVPQLGPFISFFGAFCLSLLAMVFPGIMDMCCCYAEPEGYGPGSYKLIRDIVIVVIGMCCLISGCYASIIEIIENFS